jgi:tRNA (guanine37-N1)-methyltransferase
MRIDIISVLPELLESPLSHSILKRAQTKGLLEVHVVNLRTFSPFKSKQVDDYQYGGGAGMVMMCEPLSLCIEQLKSEREYDEIIYMTPDGTTLNQKMSNSLSLKKNLMLICGHYKGIRRTYPSALCYPRDFDRRLCAQWRGIRGCRFSGYRWKAYSGGT